MINRKNIIIIAIMAIMLMGSVILSAYVAESTFVIHNVYSIISHDPIEIFFFSDYTTEELYDLESSTLTITFSYNVPNGIPMFSQPSVYQGSRQWTTSKYGSPGSDFTLELPGPYEVRPTPGSSD